MLTLGIETSCDDTGVGLYSDEEGLLSHALYSQTTHELYGGVVPELASRDHIRKISPLVEQCLKQASKTVNDLDGIAYTSGPGLIGSLLVGAGFAKGLAYSLNIPVIGVHHIEAHISSVFLSPGAPSYPFVALVISGGHTSLIHAKALGVYKPLGETLDDACGEAFDKTAKLMGLGYPGGPAIEKLASSVGSSNLDFPRPLLSRPTLDFSFSGLKTAVLNYYNSLSKPTDKDKATIAYEVQNSIAEVLAKKCHQALQNTGLSNLVVVGGVSCNKHIRKTIQDKISALSATVFFPAPEFCTDNGAMVAYLGHQKLRMDESQETAWDITAKARWDIRQTST